MGVAVENESTWKSSAMDHPSIAARFAHLDSHRFESRLVQLDPSEGRYSVQIERLHLPANAVEGGSHE